MRTALAIITVLLIMSSNTFAANSDMSASCAPNGLTASLKEKINPKSFWVEQAVNAEFMLNFYRNGGDEGDAPHTIEDCRIISKGNTIKFEECSVQIRSEIEFWSRCGQHARRMCRLYGGYC